MILGPVQINSKDIIGQGSVGVAQEHVRTVLVPVEIDSKPAKQVAAHVSNPSKKIGGGGVEQVDPRLGGAQQDRVKVINSKLYNFSDFCMFINILRNQKKHDQ